jgi:hypothetical protein
VRFSAASGLLAGLFLAMAGFINIFTGKTAGTAFLIALAPAFALPLLIAVYHQRNADVPGVFGPVAYGLNLIGLGLFSGAAFGLSPLPDSPLKNAIHGLAGLTVSWLAVTLWRTTPARQPRPRAAARPSIALDNRSR